jgi:hypothetical protein
VRRSGFSGDCVLQTEKNGFPALPIYITRQPSTESGKPLGENKCLILFLDLSGLRSGHGAQSRLSRRSRLICFLIHPTIPGARRVSGLFRPHYLSLLSFPDFLTAGRERVLPVFVVFSIV